MPLYEYECPACKGRREVLVLSAERADEKVVYCADQTQMVRVPTAANIAFKGAGFYVNDYPKAK